MADVIFVSGDLMFGSRVSGVAQQIGMQMQTVMSGAKLLQVVDDLAPKLVIVDLQAPGVDPVAIVKHLSAMPTPPHTVGFGPHVHEQKLQAAQDAGIGTVLTRGQFHSQIGEVLANFVAS